MTHTVTLETARKLHEAGIEFKDSLFIHSKPNRPGTMYALFRREYPYDRPLDYKTFAAPILTELLEVLPKVLTTGGRDYRLNVLYENNKCYLGYYDFEQVCYPISNSEYLFAAHVFTLEGHIRAFFRGYRIAINVYYQPYVDWGHSVRHINNEDNYITIARDGEDDYETAFLSALDAACKYLEEKL